jgi:murein DD-endopeptidase MepM/ murein hydrolase activator NlpD
MIFGYLRPMRFYCKFAFLYLGLTFTLANCASRSEIELEAEEIPYVEPTFRYGIAEEGFTIHEGSIRQGFLLADILLSQAVPYSDILLLEQAAENVHAVSKLATGQTYTMFCTTDSVSRAHFFVVEINREDYVVYQLRDTIQAYKGKKPVTYAVHQASGVIEQSLSKTVSDAGISSSLTHRLSDIYAWSIDFFRLQKGDVFKVIYEEKYVDGESVGIGNILAAEFTHRGTAYPAFRFESADGSEFYDSEGVSLRKAFLKAPLEYSRISSNFSMKRFHPVQKRWKAHLGTDYAAPTGTPVMATADGEVVQSEYGKYNGNFVKIRHNSTYATQYLHMSKRAVKKGERVKQGQTIGYVGATGLASGPHVCYRFWKNGKQVDPYREELPKSEPIDEKYRRDFNLLRDSLVFKLKGIDLPVEKQPEA